VASAGTVRWPYYHTPAFLFIYLFIPNPNPSNAYSMYTVENIPKEKRREKKETKNPISCPISPPTLANMFCLVG